MVGRWAVWPVMSASAWLWCGRLVPEALLFLGIALTLAATVLYLQDGVRAPARRLNLNLRSRYSRPASLTRERTALDTFPDLGALSDQELKDLIQQLTEGAGRSRTGAGSSTARSTSCGPSSLNRLRKKHEEGESVISGADVQRLTDSCRARHIPSDGDAE